MAGRGGRAGSVPSRAESAPTARGASRAPSRVYVGQQGGSWRIAAVQQRPWAAPMESGGGAAPSAAARPVFRRDERRGWRSSGNAAAVAHSLRPKPVKADGQGIAHHRGRGAAPARHSRHHLKAPACYRAWP